nr:hypothetical protein GCM10020093_052790 [Planobispora longispora]
MRTRPVLALLIVVLAIVGGSVYALTRPAESRDGSPAAPAVQGEADDPAVPAGPDAGAEDVARAYLTAWEGADLAAMDRLVVDAPDDFIERHHAFSQELGIESLALTPGTITFQGEQAAEMPFQGVRQVEELGAWPFFSALKLVVRDGRWRVAWAPETLHPALKDGGRLRLRDLPAEPAGLVTRSKERFPHDSGAENYLKLLAGGLSGNAAEGADGLALEAVTPAGEVQRLLEKPSKPGRKVVTTFSRTVQAAAARALDGVERPAAIVAVDSGTGEVLAVADRLGGRNAFLGLYPPGSTFKVVTAAALLSAGLAPTPRCPARPPTRPGRAPVPQRLDRHRGGRRHADPRLRGLVQHDLRRAGGRQTAGRRPDEDRRVVRLQQGARGPGDHLQDRPARGQQRAGLRRHRPQLGAGQPALHGPGRRRRGERRLAPAQHDGAPEAGG